MFCAYKCIFKANIFIFPDFFPIFSAYLMISIHIYCIFGIQMHIYVYFSSAGPLQGPAIGLSDSIPVPLLSNSFISFMISPLYCPNTLVSKGQVNLAPARALVGVAPGGAQNTWSTKLRWPLPISFTILGDPSTLSLSRKQKVKQLLHICKICLHLQEKSWKFNFFANFADQQLIDLCQWLPQSWRWDSG